VRVRERLYPFHLIEWKDVPAGSVVRVLDRDEAGRGTVEVLRADVRFDLVGGDDADLSVERVHLDTGKRGSRRHLVIEDVAVPVADHLVARLGEACERHLVRHGPAGDEERRLFPEEHRDPALELDDRRIVSENVVTDDRFRDGAPHLGSRARNRVASKIDCLRHPPTSGLEESQSVGLLGLRAVE